MSDVGGEGYQLWILIVLGLLLLGAIDSFQKRAELNEGLKPNRRDEESLQTSFHLDSCDTTVVAVTYLSSANILLI